MDNNTDLNNLRRNVVKRVLIILISIAALAILFISLQEWDSENHRRIFFVYWPSLTAAIIITFVKSVPELLRSIVLVSLFFIVALSELLSFGLASLTFMFFTTGVSLTAVLFNRKTGYITMLSTLVPIAVTAYLYVNGYIDITNNQQPVSTGISGWVSSSLAYLVACSSLVETVTILIRELDRHSSKIESLNEELSGLVKRRNSELSKVVEDSSRNSTLVSIQTAFPKLFHRLNTPIGNALTATSFMRENYKDKDETGRELLDLTLKSLDQARQEIEKLRSLSNLMNTGGSVHPIDFCEFIRKNREIIGADTTADIELVFEMEHFIAELEPMALIEVLNLLIHNACDHGDSPETLVVIRFRKGGDDGMEILVTDNGPGISSGEKGRIFDPFHSTSGVGRMGLGLTIARNITENRLGGKLELDESTSGTGASFLIYVPSNNQADLSPLPEPVT